MEKRVRALKILFIPLLLSLICCGKDKEPPPKPVAWGTSPKPKPAKEECDSSCVEEREKKRLNEYLQREGYFEGCGCSFEGCNPSCEAKNREKIGEKRRYKSYLKLDSSFKEIKEKYEDLFKKSIPKCNECEDCDIEDRINKISICKQSLKDAFDLGIPYPTIEEKATWDNKIKTAYNNRFGLHITDFELSIISVYYERYENIRDLYRSSELPSFSLFRTATGAKAKYYDDEADFSIGDWLDFIMALRKCKVDKWDTVYTSPNRMYWPGEEINSWVLEVYYLDKDGYINRHKTKSYVFDGEYTPPNWKDFGRTFVKTKAKIERMAKAKGKTK